MFLREKTAKCHTYLYLVENLRQGSHVRQRTIHALGRKDLLLASGDLTRLAEAFARHSDRALLLSDIDAGQLTCTVIGAPLLLGRLWEQTGCRAVIESLLADRGFEFAVERAIFATVLHRLMVSGSDRACEKWLADYTFRDSMVGPCASLPPSGQ